jgi:alpha-tubulin suppressor-like RCC1 family protein
MTMIGQAARTLTVAGTLIAGLLAVPAALAATAPPPKWIHIAAGAEFTCGIREGNTLWCWGNPYQDALGTSGPGDTTAPRQVTGPAAGWASVTAGYLHGCATRKDGGLWCWGDNTAGELGTGTTASTSPPRPVTTPAATGWASAAAGRKHTCGIRADTTLWCWGDNQNGQLGLGLSSSQDRPQQVTTPAAEGWASVAAGADADHTCATRAGATLWCWGDNHDGQLGAGSLTSQDLPQQVTTPAATGWTTPAAGFFHSCATRTHALWCWGSSFFGELGIGGTGAQTLPRRVPVPTRTGWTLIAPGAYHTCATRTGHALWCWGLGSTGQLGLGGTTDQHRPQQVTS